MLALATPVAVPEPGPDSLRIANTRPLIRPGEELVFAVSSSRFGRMGTAQMRVQAADTAEGVPAYQLSFDFSARILLFKVSDHTRSWLRADSLSTVRYSKHEHSPVTSRNEDVVVDQRLGEWSDGKNWSPLGAEHPLDELSFIYLVRSLDLQVSQAVEVRRHFDAQRNPVRIEAVARRVVAGRDVVVYEMHVPDPRQKNGSSTLRFFISDDDARLPMRIESSMPAAGQITMTLQSAQLLPVASR